ncbi:hypothetical protein M427DRAFT_36285 [Gonapodya prolifera JEL478]|uniref:F-box domain-containing protein n=1 Tax=Gonapodya prolifera (strain JEL478) TaxID=1344416 RepID=A0A139A3P5_GONPJ|nr:hypothetical protein M427DRAFT_36285 [Gonapodya prolifera JEL478]|eukprot:KXS11095.1 hypothetical protein M427DRAFT_36285 [Gonapodya prolifera JEL478]
MAPSIESHAEELILQILDLLPPRILFQCAVRVSKRWKTLVGRLFLPDGRPGVVVDVGVDAITHIIWMHSGGVICNDRKRIGGYHWFIQPADRCSLVGGRKVVANVKLMVDSGTDIIKVDIARLSKDFDEMGKFAFCGVSSVSTELQAPWRDTEEFADWLEKVPFTAARKLWIEQNLLEKMSQSAKRWSFPDIEDLHVETSSGAGSTMIPRHCNVGSRLFPNLRRLSLEIGAPGGDTHNPAAQDIFARISLLTGADRSTSPWEEIKVTGKGQSESPGLIQVVHVSASLPRLRKISIGTRSNWSSLSVESLSGKEFTVSKQLKALELSMHSLRDDHASVLHCFSTTIGALFPCLEELTLIMEMRPADMLINRDFWTFFADFVKQQPAETIWLKFYIVDGGRIFGESDIGSDLRRSVKTLEGEVRKGLADQQCSKRVTCDFWYPKAG